MNETDETKLLSLKVLTAPVILEDGRLTFSAVQLTFSRESKYIRWILDDVVPLDNILVYLDPSREPRYSPYPGGGWCSPVYSKIEEAASAGIALEESEFITCKCQNGYISEEDRASLEWCGHAAGCRKARPRPDINVTYFPGLENYKLLKLDPSESGPSLPGALVSEPAQPATTTVPKPKPSEPIIPAGGMDGIALDSLVMALLGSSDSISGGIKLMGLDPRRYDQTVVATQLLKECRFTTCQGCNVWTQVNNINNPVCADYPNCRG